MTSNLIDLQHSDVIMATSNMAENHPVGFQWVMKAKERGAKLIHVDPRYTRTSAAADIHVPLRSGTNIAFFGGLMSYAIQKNLYFKDYVVHYTNASFLLDPAFKTPTDLNGLFTGFDGTKKSYDRASWKYQLDGEGNPKRDLSLKDPQTVFQHLKRHYHELPGYLAMPLRDAHPDLKTYLEKETPKGGFWTNKPKFMVSLLKAFYDDAATKDNEFGYQWIPKRASADAYSHQHMFVDMYNGIIKGFLADGQNPAVGGPNAKLARAAMQRLDWLVVVDIFLTETAEVWKEPGKDPKEVKTEVFFIPAAPAAEKDGSLTNTMRLIQWHEKAVDPPGDVQTDAQFFCTLAHRLQKMYAGSRKERDKGFRAANFTYGAKPDHPEMVEVLKEINGVATEDISDKDGKVLYRKGQPINSFAQLTDDGKTTSGCWIYTGVTVESPDGKLINKAASRKPADGTDYLAHGWGFAWPANRRILYNRASADLTGKPWSEKKKLIWWDPAAPGQKPEDKPGKWVGLDVPDFNAVLAPDAKNGDKPFIMRSDLVGGFFGPPNDGPFPEHYEPVESPTQNLLSKQQNNPVAKIWKVPDQKNELGRAHV